MAGRKELVRFGAAWLAFKRNNLPWRWIGFSEGGLQVTYNTETTDHFVDQSTSPIKTQITSETLEAVFPAVESTLENFALAFPGSYLRDGTLHIRPASEASTAQSSGIVLIHPVYRGAPVGDIFDPTNTAYDGTDDFMFYASLVSSLDITYGREDMIHIPLTFRGSPDPAGQLGVMGNPLNNNPFEFDHLSLVTTVGTPVSETLAATGSGVVAPVTYLMGAADGFTLEDDELTFESDVAGTFTALVYAVDSTPERQKIATAYVTATVS